MWTLRDQVKIKQKKKRGPIKKQERPQNFPEKTQQRGIRTSVELKGDHLGPSH